MAQPGDPVSQFLRVTNPATGAGVAGLVLANFTLAAWYRPFNSAAAATWTHGATLTDLGGGLYELRHLLPPNAAEWFLSISHASYQCNPTGWADQTEAQDCDSLFAAGAPFTAELAAATELGTSIALELIARRWRRIDLVIRSNGVPVDLTTYSNLRLAVRSLDQTTTKLDASNGSPAGFVLTGDAAGNLRIEFPESTGTGVADIYAAVPAGTQPAAPVTLSYEITGDLGGDVTKTVPIIRPSELRIYRGEVGT